MPTPADNIEFLRAVLAGDRLTADWYETYGVSKPRSDALTAASTRKAGYSSDSFHNPRSETALTLFMLGATDGWRVGRYARPPRPQGGDWDGRFFGDVASGATGTAPGSLWSRHAGRGRLLDPDTVGFDRLVVLFEVEVAGNAFRRLTGGSGSPRDLSFLDLAGLSRWAKFDAVVIDPGLRRLYFVEAKLGSDVSLETVKYPLVNQAVRGLEAAYWVTKTQPPSDRPWSFRYVLLCPHLLFAHKLRFYSYAFQDQGSVRDMLGQYRGLLAGHHRNDRRATFKAAEAAFEAAFDDFTEAAVAAIRVVHWREFGEVLASSGDGYWTRYFEGLERVFPGAAHLSLPDRAVVDIRRRLSDAGVSV